MEKDSPQKNSVVAVVVGIIVVGVIFGIIALVGSSASSLDNTPAQGGNEVAAVATSTGPATSFNDGTFIVGTDIEPGTYRTSGGSNCYYARLSGFGGTDSDIIANENAGTGSAIVTINASDMGFQSSGCGTWTQISTAPSSETTAKTEEVQAPPTMAPNQSQSPSQPATTIVTGWSAYASTSLTEILNDPGYYLGQKVKVVGVAYDFLGEGGRGGNENYVEIAPLAGIDSPANRIMLQVDNAENYLTTTQDINTWESMFSGNGNLADGVVAYGIVQTSASFSLTSGGNTSYPVIEVTRLDECNDYACDDGASSIFPVGLTTAANNQSVSDGASSPVVAPNDSAPTPIPSDSGGAALDVSVVVNNSQGGSATPSDFVVKIDGTNPSLSSFSGNALGTQVIVEPNTFVGVSVSAVPYYVLNASSECSQASGIPSGNTYNCVITETYTPSSN